VGRGLHNLNKGNENVQGGSGQWGKRGGRLQGVRRKDGVGLWQRRGKEIKGVSKICVIKRGQQRKKNFRERKLTKITP